VYGSGHDSVVWNSGLTQEDICRISRATESALELTAYQGAFLPDVKITQVVDVLRADNLQPELVTLMIMAI
jgi:hypothetical protein